MKLVKRFFSPYVGDVLTEFFKLCCRRETAEEILGRGLPEEESKGLDAYVSLTRTNIEDLEKCSHHRMFSPFINLIKVNIF